MKTSISIIRIGKDEVNEANGNFLVNDIVLATKTMNISGFIIYIDRYKGTREEKIEQLDSVLKLYKGKNNIICTTAYISTDEFPPDKYYINDKEGYDKNKEKIKIPVSEILQREGSMLESLNFVNVNQYVGYNYKNAYIYDNGIGRKIIDHFNYLVEGKVQNG